MCVLYWNKEKRSNSQFFINFLDFHCIFVSFTMIFESIFFCCFIFYGDLVVNQIYDSEIIKEYVIRGNAAVLKCSIPSFVADFVYVDSWIDEEGTIYNQSTNYGAFNCRRIKISQTILLGPKPHSKMENN